MATGPEEWLSLAAIKEYAVGIIIGWVTFAAAYLRLVKSGVDILGSKSKLLAENASLKTEREHLLKDIAERDAAIERRDDRIAELAALNKALQS